MADDYRAQLLVVEAKLAKDPDNEELVALRTDLMEIIELSGSLEEDEELERQQKQQNQSSRDKHKQTTNHTNPYEPSSSGHSDQYTRDASGRTSADLNEKNLVTTEQSDSNERDTNPHRRQLSEAELLAKRKEKNRKKKAKLREKVKEQLDAAESVKQSWQSFANQRGLKGLTKRSIFASPCSVTGKVGVGTNGIADKLPTKGALSGAGASSSSSDPISANKQRQRGRY